VLHGIGLNKFEFESPKSFETNSTQVCCYYVFISNKLTTILQNFAACTLQPTMALT